MNSTLKWRNDEAYNDAHDAFVSATMNTARTADELSLVETYNANEHTRKRARDCRG